MTHDVGKGTRLRAPAQRGLFTQPAADGQLTDRQQFTLQLVTAAGHQGIHADQAGAAWCAHRGKHHIDERCQWCGISGREVLFHDRDVARSGNVTSGADSEVEA